MIEVDEAKRHIDNLIGDLSKIAHFLEQLEMDDDAQDIVDAVGYLEQARAALPNISYEARRDAWYAADCPPIPDYQASS